MFRKILSKIVNDAANFPPLLLILGRVNRMRF